MKRSHYTQLPLKKFPSVRKYRLHISAPDGYKNCPHCEEVKPLDAFYPAPSRPSGVVTYCIPCIAKRRAEAYHGSAAVRDQRRSQQRKYKYGITPDQFKKMMSKQKGRCVICARPFESTQKTHIDHEHVSGKVRGILCTRCNTRLAVLEDHDWCRQAERYLKKHGK